MNFRSRDVITGFIVLVILIAGSIIIFKSRNKFKEVTPIKTPNIVERLQDKFNGFEIPDDVEKTELKDATGGSSIGIATPSEVIADLPELPKNEFYQVWYFNGEKYVSLGKMRVAKGGYLYEGSIKDKKIVVSREKIFDNKIEVKILE